MLTANLATSGEQAATTTSDIGYAEDIPDLTSQDNQPTAYDSDAEVDSLEQEHIPEASCVITMNTLLSALSASTCSSEPGAQDTPSPSLLMKMDTKAENA